MNIDNDNDNENDDDEEEEGGYRKGVHFFLISILLLSRLESRDKELAAELMLSNTNPV